MLRNRCFQEMRELAIYSHLSIEDETPLGSGRQCMVSKHTNDMTTVQFCTIISFYIYHINNNRLQMVLPVWGFEWQHHCSIKLHPPDIITGTACVKCRTSQNIRMSEFIRRGLGQSRGLEINILQRKQGTWLQLMCCTTLHSIGCPRFWRMEWMSDMSE